MGQTIAEKILSAHARKRVGAGELAVCDVDFCFGQDGTSSIVIDSFRKLGVPKVNNRKRFAMVIDHSSPSPNIGVSQIHAKMRTFAAEHAVRMYDVGCGVCHQIIPEQGHVNCGDLVLGADSHTCTYGALNALATGVGSTDVAIALASGKNWFRVPETVKIVVRGTLAKGVYAKDVILHLIGALTADGCTYDAIEYVGPTIEAMDMDGRMTIANMSVEMGAKCGIMLADKKTFAWLKAHGSKPRRPVRPDPDAVYKKVYEFDVAGLVPQVARPHTVDNVAAANTLRAVRVDQGFIGTCTNGRLSDFAEAARILRVHPVKKGVRLIVAPASTAIYLDAVRKGFIDTFVRAGAVVVAPGCGPCVGTHNGVLADGEVAISTANRNFKGRMGNPEGFIYLASPATVAASVVTGVITDPRRFMRKRT